MAQFLPVAGDDREVSPAKGEVFTLPELQFFVGGFFDLFALSDGRLMVLNQDGKLLQLPRNPRATALLRDRLAPEDFIVGDVVICSLSETGAVHAHP